MPWPHTSMPQWQVASASGAQHCRRLTALLTAAALGEGVSLCVVPPSALEPALGNVVQAWTRHMACSLLCHMYTPRAM